MAAQYDEDMLALIDDRLNAGEIPTGPLLVFLLHECIEERLLRQGITAIHEALRERYGDFANYSPEVVRKYPEWFNENWQQHWRDA